LAQFDHHAAPRIALFTSTEPAITPPSDEHIQ
jgi:hypothetical protein